MNLASTGVYPSAVQSIARRWIDCALPDIQYWIRNNVKGTDRDVVSGISSRKKEQLQNTLVRKIDAPIGIRTETENPQNLR
jgi:hypothetical protein